MKSKYGCRLIIVDHLSRVRAPGKSIYEQVTNASGALSDLVKDLGVAGLILCQLNRSVENRDDQRPNMSDLRDSGAIEQDADGILLLHREDYFRVRDPSYIQTGIAEVIVAKWRDGVRGKTIRIKSDLRYQRFVDLPPQSEMTHSPEDF
jgi:replicative DNA helicase